MTKMKTPSAIFVLLCFPLSEKLEGIFRNAGITDNIRHIVNTLYSQGALKRSKDRISVQITGTGGKRFYAIPLEKL